MDKAAHWPLHAVPAGFCGRNREGQASSRGRFGVGMRWVMLPTPLVDGVSKGPELLCRLASSDDALKERKHRRDCRDAKKCS